jgi:hypothetical protein
MHMALTKRGHSVQMTPLPNAVKFMVHLACAELGNRCTNDGRSDSMGRLTDDIDAFALL